MTYAGNHRDVRSDRNRALLDTERMAYTQLTAQYVGFTGSPGWVRMKFQGSLTVADANTAAANFRSFLSNMNVFMPAGSSYTFDSAAQQFDDAGVQTGEITLTTVPSTLSGSGSGSYAGGSGAVVSWTTNAFHLGRRVRGRTFLVPMVASAFTSGGVLQPTTQSSLQAGAAVFASSSPTPVISSHKEQLGGGMSHLTAAVTGATVPNRAAILRSRRD